MKIHAVFDEGSGEVIEVLSRYGEVAAWDRTLDAAVAWAASGAAPDPDVILIKSTVPLAQFDPATGTRRDRRLALLDAVRRMRVARPRARIVLLLPVEYREERAFLSNLVALGVYDFYFVSEFTEADLARWFSERKTLADVAAYLPGPGGISGPDPAPPRPAKEEKRERRPGSLRRLAGGLGGKVREAARRLAPEAPFALRRKAAAAPEPGEPRLVWEENWGPAAAPAAPEVPPAADPATEEGLAWEEGPWEAPEELAGEQEAGPPPKEPEEGLVWEEEPEVPPAGKTPEPEAPEAEIYALGLPGVPEGAAAFASKEELFDALARKKPRAVALSAGFPGCLNLVRELRSYSRLGDVAVAVVGRADPAFVAAGADECLQALDREAAEKLLARQQRLAALWQDANTDHLTGLLNRRSLGPRLEEADRLFREHGLPYSLIMLDLDHFKKVNDARGHSAGDEVLRRLGDHLRANLRPRDAACRYGGEEIVLILAGTELAEARSVAERLRRGWEAQGVYGSTFSAGVAQAGLNGADPGEVLNAADRALYAAKQAGRNRVVAAGEEPPAVPEVRPAARVGPRAKLVAVASPSVRGVGASSTAALLAAALAAGGRRAAAVDADPAGRGLGVRLGLEPHVASAYDWRKSDLPVYAPCGAAVWALDPGRGDAPSRERLLRVLDLALDGADFTVADLGAAPDSGLVDRADLLVWVLREDRVAVEQALAYWPSRPRCRCAEVGVLFGGGRAAAMVDLFVVPFFVLAGPEDRRGAGRLARAVTVLAGRGLVVLAVGYDVPPMRSAVPLVWQPVPTYKAALKWLEMRVPDLVLVRPGIESGDFLAARLRRRGIKVARPANAFELVAALEKEGGSA